MTEPTAFPHLVATDYESFIVALQRVKQFAGINFGELDHLCGLTAGHAEKLLGPARSRGLGAVTLDALLLALPIDVQFVFNPRKMARLQKQSIRRNDTHVRRLHPRVSKDGVARARPVVLRDLARLGGHARAAILPASIRSEIARKAIRTRWKKHRAALKAAKIAARAAA